MRPPLPVISGLEAVKAFERDGWRQVRQESSHVIMEKESGRANLSIPQHKELAKGTLRKLINRADLDIEKFVQLLHGRRPEPPDPKRHRELGRGS